MDNVTLVKKIICSQYLIDDGSDAIKGQSFWGGLQFLKQCLLNVVEDQVEFAIFAEYVAQVDNVIVALFAQNANFSHHGLSHMWILFFALFKLFNCYDAARLLLLRLENFAVSALANHLENAESIH